MNCLHVLCIFLLYRYLTISSCCLPWRIDDTFDESFGTNMSLTKDSVGGLFLFKTLPKLDAVSLLLLWNNHSGSRDWRTVIFSICWDSAKLIVILLFKLANGRSGKGSILAPGFATIFSTGLSTLKTVWDFFLVKQLIAKVRPKWYIAHHSVDKWRCLLITWQIRERGWLETFGKFVAHI